MTFKELLQIISDITIVDISKNTGGGIIIRKRKEKLDIRDDIDAIVINDSTMLSLNSTVVKLTAISDTLIVYINPIYIERRLKFKNIRYLFKEVSFPVEIQIDSNLVEKLNTLDKDKLDSLDDYYVKSIDYGINPPNISLLLSTKEYD